jgi:hypothetical protein
MVVRKESPEKLNKKFGSVELLFSCNSLHLSAVMRVTSSLPKEGEAAQGVHSLDPPLF